MYYMRFSSNRSTVVSWYKRLTQDIPFEPVTDAEEIQAIGQMWLTGKLSCTEITITTTEFYTASSGEGESKNVSASNSDSQGTGAIS